jgi:hypothetical protein
MKLTEHKIPVVEMTNKEYRDLIYNFAPEQQSIGDKKITNVLPDGKELMLEGEKFYRLIVIK